MLLPPEEAGGHGENGGLEVPVDAALDRLRRRVVALERQLDARIGRVEHLEKRVAEEQRLAAAAREDAARARAEYEALTATFTMRALKRPREWYASARRLLRRP